MMELLGQVDVIPIAAGQGISLKNYGGIEFVCTGADTFTITTAPTFAGSYVTPGAIITHYYQRAGTNGTFAWTRVNQTAANTVVQASAFTSVFDVLSPMLPDTYAYVKCTPTSTGLVKAILHSALVQRAPANLVIPSA